ncbi:hypothetical protein SNEBB_006670 [Seison nebaliae]|nr:hypothetical protein SNEBB_006670 [Seison nebaliae]
MSNEMNDSSESLSSDEKHRRKLKHKENKRRKERKDEYSMQEPESSQKENGKNEREDTVEYNWKIENVNDLTPLKEFSVDENVKNKRKERFFGKMLNGERKIIDKELSYFNVFRLHPDVKIKYDAAKKFVTESTNRFENILKQKRQQKEQLAEIKRQQCLNFMCRIYVGSLHYDLNDVTIRMAFCPYGHITDLNLVIDQQQNKHRGYGFIEYTTPDAAQLAISQMNNTTLGKRTIKVSRPTNMPLAHKVVEYFQKLATDNYTVYLTNIQQPATRKEVEDLAAKQGKIVSFDMPHEDNKHLSYCYVEYEDSRTASLAVINLNQEQLHGVLLRACRCVTPKNWADYIIIQKTAQGQFISMKMKEENSETERIVPLLPFQTNPNSQNLNRQKLNKNSLTQSGNVGLQPDMLTDSNLLSVTPALQVIVGHDKDQAAINPLTRTTLTNRVLCLENMVGKEELENERLPLEIKMECKKYGTVQNVKVTLTEDQENVRIFVLFADHLQCQTAQKLLQSRLFDKRRISAWASTLMTLTYGIAIIVFKLVSFQMSFDKSQSNF